MVFEFIYEFQKLDFEYPSYRRRKEEVNMFSESSNILCIRKLFKTNIYLKYK